MKFKCDKCGICCRHLNENALYSILDRGDGVCKYLNGNLCMIYEKRPDICNVEKMYFFYKDELEYEEYLKMNEKACEQLKEKYKGEI